MCFTVQLSRFLFFPAALATACLVYCVVLHLSTVFVFFISWVSFPWPALCDVSDRIISPPFSFCQVFFVIFCIFLNKKNNWTFPYYIDKRCPPANTQNDLPGDISGQILTHIFQSMLFQTADLGLGDSDFLCHLHLGLSLKETKSYNIFFPVVESFHRLLQGKILNPVFLSVLFITDLDRKSTRLNSSHS